RCKSIMASSRSRWRSLWIAKAGSCRSTPAAPSWNDCSKSISASPAPSEFAEVLMRKGDQAMRYTFLVLAVLAAVVLVGWPAGAQQGGAGGQAGAPPAAVPAQAPGAQPVPPALPQPPPLPLPPGGIQFQP